MNKNLKHEDSMMQGKISSIIQLMTLMFILLSNSLIAASGNFQSTTFLPKTSVSESPQQQEKKITGKITDPTGAPIPGASIVIKGTTVGTTSDTAGDFSLSVPNDAQVLTFSFIGMKTQELEIGNNSTFNVTLSEYAIGVDEVVVIGYGSIRKSDATGSLSVIGSNDFNSGPVSSPDMLLNGHIAGVQVTTNNGQPGANTSVRKRHNYWG